MKQEGLKYFTDTNLTAVGLIIFFAFFVGLLFWVYRKSSSEIYIEMSRLPLKEENSK